MTFDEVIANHPEFQYANPEDWQYIGSEDAINVPAASAARLSRSVIEYTQSIAKKSEFRVPDEVQRAFDESAKDLSMALRKLERKGGAPVGEKAANQLMEIMSHCEQVLIATEV